MISDSCCTLFSFASYIEKNYTSHSKSLPLTYTHNTQQKYRRECTHAHTHTLKHTHENE